jgi:hypothetical protein
MLYSVATLRAGVPLLFWPTGQKGDGHMQGIKFEGKELDFSVTFLIPDTNLLWHIMRCAPSIRWLLGHDHNFFSLLFPFL